MLALPNQTIDDLKESLEKVISLNPNHISLYSLILEDGTKLKEEVQKGILTLPDEDIERKMYHETKRILEKNGYNHYEISNFSKCGFESKHNMNCWDQREYLGFGLASHSYYNNIRFNNETNFCKYIAFLEEKRYNKIVELDEIQTKEDIMKEYMMLGFRKIEGISISKFKSKFGIHPLFYFRFELSKLEEEELIEIDLDQIRLSKKGLDFANLVFEEFV